MPEHKKANILLVDDKPENLLAFESILEELDCNLVKARSGQKALRLVLKQHFDLILLDVKMPDMSGIEVAKLMRGKMKSRYIPIIFVTGISKQEKYDFEGTEIGEIDYLFKPVDPDILKSKVREFLEISRQKQVIENQSEALRRKIEELENEISGRKHIERELIAAKEAADATNQAKSDFLANMSHELRTPLGHIIGFTELVVDKNFGELNEIQEEYLNDVLHSSEHLLSLINDILDLSKVEAGWLELKPTEVNFRMLLENSLLMIKEKAIKLNIKISTEIRNIPETIEADERKLKQILYNLLSNAVKFTPDGGSIRILVELSPEKFIKISATDTGIGLNKEDLTRIFNPFEQVEHSRSRKYQGTGLGLSLTKSLVELHGGAIWAESEGEGQGSTFTFTIPV